MLRAIRLGVLVAALGVACSTVTPRYETRRLPRGTTAWEPCSPGHDREERLASWCPRQVALGSDADLGPRDGDRARVSVTGRPDVTGPVVLALDSLTYVPAQPDVPLKGLLDEFVRAPPTTNGLLPLRRVLRHMRIGMRRHTRWFADLPARVDFRLPRRRDGRRGAWAVWAWPGGKAVERVDVSLANVPAGARLAVSFALGEPGRYAGAPDVTFAVETGDGGRLWSQRVRGGRTGRRAAVWHDAEIPLSSPDRLDLRLVATVDGGADAFSYPIWGEPLLLVPTTAPPDARPNVLLVSLDTLRADSLTVSGRTKPIMPALESLAAGGVAFRDALATFPSTTASHMTMFTSLPACAHGVLMVQGTLPPGIATLAESFAAAGWSTGAVTEDGLIKGSVGFARGFHRYVDQAPHERPLGAFARGVTRALEWIARDTNRRFFLFLHTYQPHEPYKVPPRLRDRFPVPNGADTFTRLRVDYDAGVHHTDAALGRLLRALKARGLLGTTLVAVTSDHGQAFGEHGFHGHGTQVFQEQLRVPLVFHHPTLASGGRRVDAPVSLVDLAPTLLDAAGIPAPASFQGRSLLPILRGDPAAPSPSSVFSENLWGARTTAHRTDHLAWILTPNGLALYNRRQDPREQVPLPTSPVTIPAIVGGRHAIASYVAQCEADAARLRGPAAPTVMPIDPATRDALKALGYAE